MSNNETQPFTMHVEGDYRKPIVTIEIPRKCCGVNLEVINVGDTSSLLNSCKHSGIYQNVWKYYYLDKIHVNNSLKITSKHGHSCVSCREYNEYAESNQRDGTFKCYSCRSTFR
jgi:hypothetical protein